MAGESTAQPGGPLAGLTAGSRVAGYLLEKSLSMNLLHHSGLQWSFLCFIRERCVMSHYNRAETGGAVDGGEGFGFSLILLRHAAVGPR